MQATQLHRTRTIHRSLRDIARCASYAFASLGRAQARSHKSRRYLRAKPPASKRLCRRPLAGDRRRSLRYRDATDHIPARATSIGRFATSLAARATTHMDVRVALHSLRSPRAHGCARAAAFASLGRSLRDIARCASYAFASLGRAQACSHKSRRHLRARPLRANALVGGRLRATAGVACAVATRLTTPPFVSASLAPTTPPPCAASTCRRRHPRQVRRHHATPGHAIRR